MHVVLAGPANGKPLIFFHGFPEFWFAWRDQIDHFVSLGYRVIVPDQRGYNLSGKPAAVVNYSINLLAGDIVGLLDKVTSSKASIVGHDVGAAVTWYLIARCPDRFVRAAIFERATFPCIAKTPYHEPCATAQELVHLLFSASLVARSYPAQEGLLAIPSRSREYFASCGLF